MEDLIIEMQGPEIIQFDKKRLQNWFFHNPLKIIKTKYNLINDKISVEHLEQFILVGFIDLWALYTLEMYWLISTFIKS